MVCLWCSVLSCVCSGVSVVLRFWLVCLVVVLRLCIWVLSLCRVLVGVEVIVVFFVGLVC